MAGLSAAIPFVAAIAFILISPQLVAKVKKTIRAQVSRDRDSLAIPRDALEQPPLSLSAVNDHIDYAADAIQIFPVILLPVFGAVFESSKNGGSSAGSIYLCIAVLAAISLEAWVLNKSTADYVSRKFLRVSVVAWVALASNLAGLAIVWTSSQA
ncbi:hypothetical protein [Paenarthrobacter nicotinovorans]|uniref:hypothetical protein n=1 Tax=Paenarthrobacter nicotinovorans TaxID=29320 RepID=UPI003DA3885E